MRIGLEATYAFMGRGGIDRYAAELCRELLARDDHDYRLFTAFFPFRQPPVPPQPFEGSLRRKGAMAQSEIVRRVWSRLSAPTVERFTGPIDLFHTVHHWAVPVRRARQVVTVHDLSFEYPEFAIPSAELFRRDVRSAVRRASRVVAVSDFTRRELVERLGVDPARIRVVPSGVRVRAVPAEAPEGTGPPHFLWVGQIEPRKNLPFLARSFALARARFRLPHHLVLVGRPGARARSILHEVFRTPAASFIDYRAFVSDAELTALYRGATAVAYASLYEGFGLPVLEAMAAGTPVVALACGAVPEAAGDAALLVPEVDPDAFAAAMADVGSDARLRERLVARGAERVREFTWGQTAERTVAVYEEACRG